MKYKTLSLIGFILSAPIYAEEMERLTMTSCAYQAGTAREIQTIRQTEGDDWSVFEQKVKNIYQEGQGRSDLLAIAKTVYLQPTKTSTDDIYEAIFRACVKRSNGTDENA